MELWIRSQDKEDLVKAYNLRILNQSDIAVNVKFNMSSLEYLVIGKYSTKERALEVLDAINNMLKPKGIIKFDSLLSEEGIKKAGEYFDNQYTIFNKNMELIQQVDTYVYEMPEE